MTPTTSTCIRLTHYFGFDWFVFFSKKDLREFFEIILTSFYSVKNIYELKKYALPFRILHRRVSFNFLIFENIFGSLSFSRS